MEKCTQQCFNLISCDENGVRYLKTMDYSDIKRFPDYCVFEEVSTFADDTIFGEGCIFGGLSTFGARCQFGAESCFERYCIFGDGCTFDEYSFFGDRCTFGKSCVFHGKKFMGNGCEFQHGCRFITSVQNESKKKTKREKKYKARLPRIGDQVKIYRKSKYGVVDNPELFTVSSVPFIAYGTIFVHLEGKQEIYPCEDLIIIDTKR